MSLVCQRVSVWSAVGLQNYSGSSTDLCMCGTDTAGMDPEFKKAWLQSWKWAAITAAVVTSPVIGKVAKVSFERFLGTIAGLPFAYLAKPLCSPSCLSHSAMLSVYIHNHQVLQA